MRDDFDRLVDRAGRIASPSAYDEAEEEAQVFAAELIAAFRKVRRQARPIRREAVRQVIPA